MSAALALASCTASDVSERPSPAASVPAASPTGNADPCPIGEPVAGGDVIAASTVVDAHGPYCAVAPAPRSSAMQFDPAVVDPWELELWGFSEADALAAQRSAVTFVVEHVLDSSLLDTDANGTFADWLLSVPYHFVDFVPPEETVLQGRLPLLARDGAPRSVLTEVAVTEVSAQGGKAGPTALTVRLTVTSHFRPAEGTAAIPVDTTYGLAIDSEGAIVGMNYSFVRED